MWIISRRWGHTYTSMLLTDTLRVWHLNPLTTNFIIQPLQFYRNVHGGIVTIYSYTFNEQNLRVNLQINISPSHMALYTTWDFNHIKITHNFFMHLPLFVMFYLRTCNVETCSISWFIWSLFCYKIFSTLNSFRVVMLLGYIFHAILYTSFSIMGSYT